VNPISEAKWEPTTWWKVLTASGAIWTETSDEEEARSQMDVPGRTLHRYHRRQVQEFKWIKEEG
jgi:alkylated DNA nucleotide flippase Atl1